MHFFWSIYNFDFNLLFKLGYQNTLQNQNEAVSEFHKVAAEETETNICFI